MAMEIKNPQGGPSQRQTGTAVWHEWKLLAAGRIFFGSLSYALKDSQVVKADPTRLFKKYSLFKVNW